MDGRERRVSPRGRSRQSGFSYIEILVGIVILAIVAGGIAEGLAQSSRALGTSKTDQTAQKLATAALDDAHRMKYDAVGVVGGSPPGTIPATQNQVVGSTTYTVATDVIYVDDPALGQPHTYVNYKKVTVTVTPQTNLAHAYTDSTLVAPPAIGSIAGKSTIIAQVVDSLTLQPVAGAPVTADLSTSPSQTRSTGSDGKVIFAGLEPSAIPVNDPKYKYRLTIGLPDPWVTDPANTPALAQQHLTASQTWNPTLKVFKKATINVNVSDAGTGQPITERTKVTVTSPGPSVISDNQTGYTGLFSFTSLGGQAIQPSTSNFTVAVQADCYPDASIARAVPTGYPANTSETFNFSLTRAPSGYLDVTLRSTAPGNPVIGSAQVQVSGGQANIAPRVRDTDVNGFTRFCLDPSGSTSYVVSAAKAGFGAGSVLATVNQNQTTPLTMYLVPAPSTGTVRLNAGQSNKLVRLQALSGTYDASQSTNNSGYADFTGLAAGNYNAYIATGFSGGNPVWNAGKVVSATGGQITTYAVP